jgi:hypothetical protein
MNNARGKGKIGNEAAKPKPEAQKKKLAPIRETVFFKQMNLEGLNKALLDTNTELTNNGHESAIVESQVKHINYLIVKLKDPKIYSYIASFTSFEQTLVPQLVKWPTEKIVPVFDLLRIVLTHHASSFFFSGVDSGL